jgi:hypothetical protein
MPPDSALAVQRPQGDRREPGNRSRLGRSTRRGQSLSAPLRPKGRGILTTTRRAHNTNRSGPPKPESFALSAIESASEAPQAHGFSTSAPKARSALYRKLNRLREVAKMRKFTGNNEFAASRHSYRHRAVTQCRHAVPSRGATTRDCYHAAGAGGGASGRAGGDRNSLATTARGGGFVTRLTTTPATTDAAKAKMIG